MQHSNKKTKEKRSNFFMYVRLFACSAIVFGAIFLKASNAPILTKVSEKVSEELEIESAVEAISDGIGGAENGVFEVFKEKEEEVELQEEGSFEDFYIGDSREEIEKELEMAEEKEKKLAVETLSFQMSEEELLDDTAAEPFKIPPPSYCSYNKEQISFKFTTPLRGVITSRFGYRDHPIIEDASFHTGLDIAANSGRDIVSFAAGKVIDAGKNSTYGNYLLIEHRNGIRSFYGHNSKLLVKKGQKVSLGQKIAKVGSTGMSTGPHLHFEVRKGTTRLDPALYISPESV